MIVISVNNQTEEIPADTSLAEFLTGFMGDNSQFAAAVNNEFVPKSQHGSYLLQAGDLIDIVSPVGGG